MKFCSKCGKELVDEAVICINCGCAVGAPVDAKKVVVGDAPNMGWAVLGFFFPIVGLILYIINKDTSPCKASSAGKGALFGFCLNIFISLFSIIMVAL